MISSDFSYVVFEARVINLCDRDIATMTTRVVAGLL